MHLLRRTGSSLPKAILTGDLRPVLIAGHYRFGNSRRRGDTHQRPLSSEVPKPSRDGNPRARRRSRATSPASCGNSCNGRPASTPSLPTSRTKAQPSRTLGRTGAQGSGHGVSTLLYGLSSSAAGCSSLEISGRVSCILQTAVRRGVMLVQAVCSLRVNGWRRRARCRPLGFLSRPISRGPCTIPVTRALPSKGCKVPPTSSLADPPKTLPTAT